MPSPYPSLEERLSRFRPSWLPYVITLGGVVAVTAAAFGLAEQGVQQLPPVFTLPPSPVVIRQEAGASNFCSQSRRAPVC